MTYNKNQNQKANTKFYGLDYSGLASNTNKILNNNMHVKAPLLKASVRLFSSRDNSAFIKLNV